MRLWRWFLSLLKPSTKRKGSTRAFSGKNAVINLTRVRQPPKRPSDAGVASRLPIPYP